MWLFTALQREGSSQVLLQQWGLLDLSQQSLVHNLLVFNTFSLDFLLWLFFTEEVGFSLLLSSQLFSGEVSRVELFDGDTFQRDSGRSGDNVTRVNSSQWNTVDLEWARDQQSVVFQVLQVDDSLTSETTSQ